MLQQKLGTGSCGAAMKLFSHAETPEEKISEQKDRK
jgi:hypothetical protein